MLVATYNIRKCVGLDWRRRPDRVIDVLAELHADIVCVQEADRRFGERRGTLPTGALLAEAGLRVVPVDSNDASHGWHGNAILVSRRAEPRAARRIDLPSSEPRGAVIADLELDGRRLRVVAAHLGLRARDRARQAETILAALSEAEESEGPALEIVAGDLNTWQPNGLSMRVFERRLTAAPGLPSFHASTPMAPLDRILVGPGGRILRHGVHRSALARRASDHLPVWADVEPAPAGADAPRREEASA